MNNLDDAFTCHNWSWTFVCAVCEQEEFDKAMHDQIETNYNDELYEYEEDK
jgi:hypothetical protein